MTKQFDGLGELDDRREIMILFQKLGSKFPEPVARTVRAQWLESLMQDSLSLNAPLKVNPDACHPAGAYMLFVQIVGVLGVPIRLALRKLETAIRDT